MEALLEEAIADTGVNAETIAPEGTIEFGDSARAISAADAKNLARNGLEVLAANQAAATVETDSLATFFELIYAVDTDYMDTPEPPRKVEAGFEWEDVQRMLSESQEMLVAMQRMLSLVLEEIGVADHEHIRVYADDEGCLRLVSPHPDRDAIEAELNRPERLELRSLHRAAMAGLGLAGSLVGNSVSPAQVAAQVKAGFDAA